VLYHPFGCAGAFSPSSLNLADWQLGVRPPAELQPPILSPSFLAGAAMQRAGALMQAYALKPSQLARWALGW